MQIAAFGQNRQSGPCDKSHALNAHGGPHGRLDFESETFLVHAPEIARCDATREGSSQNYESTTMVAQAYSIMPQNSGKDYKAREVDVAQPLMAGGPVGGNQGGDYILQSAVRRLTPKECERLQGFPDDYTRIPVRKTEKKVTRLRPDDMWECINGEWWLMAADGPRYKQLGNSWAVPKFRWLGERITRLMPTATNDNQEPRRAA